jgi:hypothetical protein
VKCSSASRGAIAYRLRIIQGHALRPVAMNDALQGHDGGGSDQGRNESDPAESQMRLMQALRTLRGIRQRYKFDHAGRPDSYSLSVQVALGHTDMCWIAAAIEAVEKAIAAGAAEAARSKIQASPGNINWADDSSSCNVSAHGESVGRR